MSISNFRVEYLAPQMLDATARPDDRLSGYFRHQLVITESRKREAIQQVIDRGGGLSVEKQTQLFEPFKRLHAHHEFEGTGIGLANVKRIVERHGGTVTAEGRPGEGAVFTVALRPA